MLASTPAFRSRKRTTIDVNAREDIQYWTERLNVSEEQIRAIVELVGTLAVAVEHEIEMRGLTPPVGHCSDIANIQKG